MKPTEYPQASLLTWDTQLYTQLRDTQEGPQNYRFTMDQVWAFFQSEGALMSKGVFSGHAAAAASGVAVGEYYELAFPNDFGLPEGLVIKRIV